VRGRCFFFPPFFLALYLSLSQSWHTLSHAPKVELSNFLFNNHNTHSCR
jgi:hypothetical protein